MIFVHRLEVDHGLAAIPAFAVDVLEQMQRQRPGTVEQEYVTFLYVHQVAIAEAVDEFDEAAPRGRIDEAVTLQGRAKLGAGGADILVGIGQQNR